MLLYVILYDFILCVIKWEINALFPTHLLCELPLPPFPLMTELSWSLSTVMVSSCSSYALYFWSIQSGLSVPAISQR